MQFADAFPDNNLFDTVKIGFAKAKNCAGCRKEVGVTKLPADRWFHLAEGTNQE